MKRLAAIATLALVIGIAWTAPTQAQVEQRARPRNVYCHYRSLDGRTTWTTTEVQATIRCAASRFGVDVSTAMYIANRESNFQPLATNPFSGTCGIYQHMPRYWPGRVAHFRQVHPFWHVYGSCYNPRSNVLVSLDMARHSWAPWGG